MGRRSFRSDLSEQTYREVAAELGCSPELVRHIEWLALDKCRRWCEQNGYRLEDLLPPGDRYRSAALRLVEE